MRNLLYLVILVLCACNSRSPPSTPDIVVISDPIECWVNLSWIPPTERVDNTPLSIDELAIYTIWIWDIRVQDALDTQASPVLMIEIEAILISYEIRALGIGTHYFSLTVTDNNGLESDHSNEAEKICE